MSDLILQNSIVVSIFMTIVFLIACIIKDNSIVDIAWGLGFIAIAFTSLIHGEQSLRAIIITILVTLWGLRLAMHIAVRKKGKGEDWRYAAWRESWGNWLYIRSFLQIYTLQGLLMLVIALPIMFVHLSSSATWTTLDWIGLSVWIIGFLFESIGDFQMYHFKRNPKNKGKIFTEGLWRYTRHPNYFGECTLWWGIFLMVLNVDGALPFIMSPLLLTFLLLKVSGVTMLEKKYIGSSEYQDYARRTSTFIPWLPNKN